jgi:hypothetical protein
MMGGGMAGMPMDPQPPLPEEYKPSNPLIAAIANLQGGMAGNGAAPGVVDPQAMLAAIAGQPGMGPPLFPPGMNGGGPMPGAGQMDPNMLIQLLSQAGQPGGPMPGPTAGASALDGAY